MSSPTCGYLYVVHKITWISWEWESFLCWRPFNSLRTFFSPSTKSRHDVELRVRYRDDGFTCDVAMNTVHTSLLRMSWHAIVLPVKRFAVIDMFSNLLTTTPCLLLWNCGKSECVGCSENYSASHLWKSFGHICWIFLIWFFYGSRKLGEHNTNFKWTTLRVLSFFLVVFSICFFTKMWVFPCYVPLVQQRRQGQRLSKGVS